MHVILGVDEVGRGAWAGPMVVGAVVLGQAKIDGLADSKKLSPKKRQELAFKIKEQAVALATGWVSSREIDKMGLSEALKLAARRAVSKIDCDYDELIIDGTIRLIDDPRVTTLPKADNLVAAVSAASIVAKVARDMYMTKLAEQYPNYGFEDHVGYGTAKHQAALQKFGVLPIHRQSFRPVAELCSVGTSKSTQKPSKNTTAVGNSSEAEAAAYLVAKGHEIIARNWKTKYCEIDIISAKNQALYFTEVKYRRNSRAGGGLEAIDKKKQNQMRFAAQFYLEGNPPGDGTEVYLSAVALTGQPPEVEAYVENIW